MPLRQRVVDRGKEQLHNHTIKLKLQTHFQLKERGVARFVLAIEVRQSKDRSASLRQTQYIKVVAERFNQCTSKPLDNPSNTALELSSSDMPTTLQEKDEMRSRPYRWLIGCLIYILSYT